LALLLLHAGQTVSSDRSIDALWGERPPRTAQGALGALLIIAAAGLVRFGEKAPVACV
jgi:DNA-binding SARP family transcriptional activator